MDLNTILYMGGFGWYVWPAYLITISIFGFNILFAWLEKRRVKKILHQHFMNNPYES